MGPEAVLRRLVGEVCWRAARGYGSFLTFDFGPVLGPPNEGRGAWHLWVYFGDWRLTRGAEVLATGHDGEEVIEAAVARFNGKKLVQARVDPNSAVADFGFEDDLRVHVDPNPDDGVDEAEWWLLFTPDDTVLTVGPSAEWEHSDAHAPRRLHEVWAITADGRKVDGTGYHAMSPPQVPVRVEVDFNYGGGHGNNNVVYLSPKRGDRSGMDSRVDEQFRAAGVEPRDGMHVLLVGPAADVDDNGVTCDMEVIGTLAWVDDGFGWRARFDRDALALRPSRQR